MDAAKNFAKGTLAAGIDDTETSLTLLSGEGARFPVAPFNATIGDASIADPADDPDREIVRVTAIATDTFTIERGAESSYGGGAAHAHDTEGRTYKLIAGLTAKAINEEMLPVSKSGDNYTVGSEEDLTLNAAASIILNATGSAIRLNAQAAGVVADLSGGVAAIGDVDGNNTGVAVRADDNTGQIGLQGLIGTDQTASAGTPGTVVAKLPIRNLAGTLIGYLPIYDSIA